MSVRDYRFANKRSNVSMGVMVDGGSVVGLCEAARPPQAGAVLAAPEALLTTEWGPQQTSVVGCVRTSWITG